MNTLFQKCTAVAGLAVTIGLGACQENSLVSPDRPVLNPTESVNSLNSSIDVGLPKKYVLTKRGNATLTYQADGRLADVAYDPSPIFGHVGYSYTDWNGFFYMTAQASPYTKKLSFMTDPATGFCDQTFINDDYKEKWKHSYDAQGHIRKSYEMMNDQDVHFEYSFDAVGDLVKIVEFDALNKPKSETLVVYYQDKPDKYPLNRDWATPVEPFLHVLGKPSKHLVKRITKNSLPDNVPVLEHEFVYKLNADGYVTEEKIFKVGALQAFATIPYEYKLVYVGLQTQ